MSRDVTIQSEGGPANLAEIALRTGNPEAYLPPLADFIFAYASREDGREGDQP
jgi:hypothetical protein